MSRPNWNSGQVSNWGRDPQIVGGAASAVQTSGAYLTGDRLANVAGTTADYASTPDSAALDITGDIEIVVRLKLNNWGIKAGNGSIVSKRATSQDAYQLYLPSGSSQLEWRWFEPTFKNVTSSTGTPFADGETGWIKVEFDVNNGSSQSETKFYTAADQETEPTSWTQLGTTRVTAGVATIASTTAPLWIGVDNFGVLSGAGDYYRVIIRNGIGGTVAFDANFSSASAGALAFTESSTNAATVTINTTRYTYGLPNVQWSTSNATQALTANTVYYQPFLLTAPAIVDGTQFHVTTGPASSANVRTGIYAADGNLQPTGAPILDAGNTAVGTSATGTFFTRVTPVTLQPGLYLTAINASVGMTMRVQRGGIVGTDIANGTSSIISLMSRAQTQGAFPNPGASWNTRTFAATGPNHMMFLRWSPAS